MGLVQQLASSKVSLSNTSVAAETAHLALLVIDLLSMGVDSIPNNVLEPVARLVTLCPQLQPLRKAFCKLVAIHYFHKKLTAHLYIMLRQPEGFSVPKWWPSPRALIKDHTLLWTTLMTIDYQDPDDAWIVCDIIPTVVKLLNVFERIYLNKGVILEDLKEISLILCLGNANKELVLLMLSHDKNVTEILQKLAADKSQTFAAEHATIILDNVIHMPSILNACGTIFDLSGAKALTLDYENTKKKIFQIAGSSPFTLIIDVMNQGPEFEFQHCPILVPAIATAAYVIDDLCSYEAELYSLFNSCSQTSSLLLILSDFGYMIACNLFLHNEEAYQLLKPMQKFFSHWEFPPISKPNYFFTDEDKRSSSIEQTEDLKDMNNALILILKTTEKILKKEVEILELYSEIELLEKIIVSKVEHMLAFLIAVLISGSKFDFGSPDSKIKYAIVVSTIGTLLQSIKNKSLVWITLFNFANDSCYTNVRLVKIFEYLFELLVSKVGIDADSKIFESGLSQFFITFNDGSLDYPNIVRAICFQKSDPGSISVNYQEYEHLYEKSFRVKEIEQEGPSKSKASSIAYSSNVSNSSRQQSIHVDKYR